MYYGGYCIEKYIGYMMLGVRWRVLRYVEGG